MRLRKVCRLPATGFVRTSVREPVALAVALVLAGASWEASAAAQSFQGMGDLPGGTIQTYAFAASADGTAAAGWGTSANGQEAFRWTSGSGIVGLGSLANASTLGSVANGISADGLVIAGYSKSPNTSSNGNEAFRWTASGGMVGLGIPSGATSTYGYDISTDGSVIVGEIQSSTRLEAYRWTNSSGMQRLGGLPGGRAILLSRGFAVSGDGSAVVGQADSPSGNQAFRWTSGGGMIGLGDLAGGAFSSEARAASTNGSAVVGTSTSGTGNTAFRWTSATGMINLGDLPGGTVESYAYAVSGDGSLVGGYSNSTSGFEAFLWDADHGMRGLKSVFLSDYGLDVGNWTLGNLTSISADGRTFAGYGTNPSGNTEAWVAVVPEPSALAALGVAAAPLLVRRRRTRADGTY